MSCYRDFMDFLKIISISLIPIPVLHLLPLPQAGREQNSQLLQQYGMLNNSYYQIINILMRNAITSKEPPSICIAPIDFTRFSQPISRTTPRQNININCSKIVETISRTINQINQKINDIGTAFITHSNNQFSSNNHSKTSLAETTANEPKTLQKERSFRQGVPNPMITQLQFYEKQATNRTQKSTATNLMRGKGKENELNNSIKPNHCSKQVRQSAIIPNWTSNNPFNNTEDTMQDLGFSSIHQSKDLSDTMTFSNFNSSITLHKWKQSEDISTPKILRMMQKKPRKSTHVSFSKDSTLNESIEQPYFSSGHKSELKRLLANLNDQIMLDDILLTIKEWFTSNKSSNKWQQLQAEMKKAGICIGELGIKSIFLPNSDEESAFSINLSDYTITDLVNSYIIAERHWEEAISHQFDINKLTGQSFIEEEIDLQRNSYISIQDLVYYINQKLYTFYRNRDLRLIFKRLKKTSRLYFEDLQESLKRVKLR